MNAEQRIAVYEAAAVLIHSGRCDCICDAFYEATGLFAHEWHLPEFDALRPVREELHPVERAKKYPLHNPPWFGTFTVTDNASADCGSRKNRDRRLTLLAMCIALAEAGEYE